MSSRLSRLAEADVTSPSVAGGEAQPPFATRLTTGPILDTGVGPIRSTTYLQATHDNVLWGRLPCAADRAVLEVVSGTEVTIDTISHEGILEDQGRDPCAFFEPHGVPGVLVDTVALAASDYPRTFGVDGPHVITGPIAVAGAEPGDLLAITLLETLPRVPYGVITNRHGKGALPDEFPLAGDIYNVFAALTQDGKRATLALAPDSEEHVSFAINPFLGIMGVAAAGQIRPNSVPPGPYGGNIDINLLTVGSTLYLPVLVPGALAYVGDPHFAQGDGEVALTALEAPLRATVRLDVVPRDEAVNAFGELAGPLGQTAEFLIPTGLDPDLNVAMRNCVRAAVALLCARYGMDQRHAYAYLSAATDFNISQVVDVVTGVHGRIRTADFA